MCVAKNVCPKASSTGTVLPVKSHALRGITKPQKNPNALLCNAIMESSALRPTECTHSASSGLICTGKLPAKGKKNMHINMHRLGKSPGQLFRRFPFLVRFYLIFAPLVFSFSQLSWQCLCILMPMSWCFLPKDG